MRAFVLFLGLTLLAAPAAFADHHGSDSDLSGRLERLEKKVYHLYEMIRAHHSDGERDGSHCDKAKRCDKGDCDTGRCAKSKCDKGGCDQGKCAKSKCDKGSCDKSKCCKSKCDKGGCDKGKCCKSKCDKGGCDKGKCCKSKCDKGSYDKGKCDKSDCAKGKCDKARCDKQGKCDDGRCGDVAVTTSANGRFVARLEELIQAEPISDDDNVIARVEMTPVRANVIQHVSDTTGALRALGVASSTPRPSVAEQIERYEEMIRDAETEAAVSYFLGQIAQLRVR